MTDAAECRLAFFRVASTGRVRFYCRSIVFYRENPYIGPKEVCMLNQEKTGNYITEKRKQLGMTQKQLADQIGITDKAVSKWERGGSRS